jgi:hypothetical protein
MTWQQLLDEIFFLDGILKETHPFKEVQLAPVDLACWFCSGLLATDIADRGDTQIGTLWSVYFCLKNYVTTKETVFNHYNQFYDTGKSNNELYLGDLHPRRKTGTRPLLKPFYATSNGSTVRDDENTLTLLNTLYNKGNRNLAKDSTDLEV